MRSKLYSPISNSPCGLSVLNDITKRGRTDHSNGVTLEIMLKLPALSVSLSPSKLPFKNSNPPCAGPTVDANYHGIVTADFLAKGLSRRAIATRKLKGVNRDKGHERFILVRPLAVKVRPSTVDVVLLGFDDQGANTLTWLSIYCFLP